MADVSLLVQKLCFHVVEAQSVDGVGKPFAGDALIPEETDDLLHHVQNLFFRGEHIIQSLGSGGLFAPAATDGDLVAVGIGNGVEQAFVPAPAAVVAGAGYL